MKIINGVIKAGKEHSTSVPKSRIPLQEKKKESEQKKKKKKKKKPCNNDTHTLCVTPCRSGSVKTDVDETCTSRPAPVASTASQTVRVPPTLIRVCAASLGPYIDVTAAT
jgi:hypothetical protein